MTEVQLTKHRAILTKITETRYGVLFSEVDDEGVASVKNTLSMAQEMWAEMGRPEEITITVEPGDQLNVPEEEDVVLPSAESKIFVENDKGQFEPVKVDYRSASTGQYVTEGEALENPETTVAETS